MSHKIISNLCSIRNPSTIINFQKIDSIGSSPDEGGGVKESGVEVFAMQPGFSRF